ncbi:MAG UNVERIFIED_CONTAM: hypothetical protein LOD86_00430 [Thermobifida fusca]
MQGTAHAGRADPFHVVAPDVRGSGVTTRSSGRIGGEVVIEHYTRPVARITPIEENVMTLRTYRQPHVDDLPPIPAADVPTDLFMCALCRMPLPLVGVVAVEHDCAGLLQQVADDGNASTES